MGWRDLTLCLKSTECLRKPPSALHRPEPVGAAGQVNLEYLEGEIPSEPPPCDPGSFHGGVSDSIIPSEQRSRNPCKHQAGLGW